MAELTLQRYSSLIRTEALSWDGEYPFRLSVSDEQGQYFGLHGDK